MTHPNFDSLFEAASLEMMAQFIRSASGNRPDEIGAPRELQIRKFLSNWLPAKYGISKGYVLNPEKIVSKECDVVIFNSDTCPKFYYSEENEIRFFPKNEVYFTLEVKSVLNRKELEDALVKIASVKSMSNALFPGIFNQWENLQARIAFESDTDEVDDYDFRKSKRRSTIPPEDEFEGCYLKIKQDRPIQSTANCGLFAYSIGKSSLETLQKELISIDYPPDIVVVLDQGILVKLDESTLLRYQSLVSNKPTYEFQNSFDSIHRKIVLSTMEPQYLLLEPGHQKITLMYFYIFLMDFLNSFIRNTNSYAGDIISVWNK